MNTKKMLALAMCAVLLVVSTVFVTVAFLTSQDAVQNTFTVGNVTITLDEADVDDTDNDGNVTERDKANAYKLIPGKSYEKDPTIHVAGDEACYLFVKVENGLDEEVTVDGKTYEGVEADGETSIAAQMASKGWYLVEGQSNVYYYGNEDGKLSVAPGTDKVVFTTFKVADDVTNEAVAAYDDAEINVYAYAIQADGLETLAPEVIWTKF